MIDTTLWDAHKREHACLIGIFLRYLILVSLFISNPLNAHQKFVKYFWDQFHQKRRIVIPFRCHKREKGNGRVVQHSCVIYPPNMILT